MTAPHAAGEPGGPLSSRSPGDCTRAAVRAPVTGPVPTVRVACVDGPLAGCVGAVDARDARAVLWLTLDASGRLSAISGDSELLRLVAGRAAGGGVGWVPYRRAEVTEAQPGRGAAAYRWDSWQDTAGAGQSGQEPREGTEP